MFTSLAKRKPERVPAGNGRRRGRRRRWLWTSGVVVVALVAVIVGLDAASGRPAKNAVPQSRTSPTASASPPALVGVVNNSRPSEQEDEGFQKWLGVPLGIVGDYVDSQTWSAMPQSPQLDHLQQWLEAHPGGQVEVSVGLLPSTYVAPVYATTTEEKARVEAMAAGAAGEFDRYWTALAQRLVAGHMSAAILRLGWEAAGNWFPWSAVDAEADYAAYFRRIVTTMRAVPGAHFRFDWNLGIGSMTDGGSQLEAYPGDAYVDYVGFDLYDRDYSVYPTEGTITSATQQRAWLDLLDGSHGLKWLAGFARNHHKPLLIGEWGLIQEGANHGGGDDPYFIRSMYDFFYRSGYSVYAALYFNEDPGGSDGGLSSAVYVPDWGDTNYQFPAAAAEFRSLFSRAP